MKHLVLILAIAFGTSVSAMAADPTKNKPVEPVKAEQKKEELNCVKKDKNGKCPPAPKSPKPTPKKPADKETKK